MNMHFVYLLYAEKFDSFYIGYSTDLERRLKEHNAGLTKSTKAKQPWKLVYFESYDSQHDALKRERFLKAQRNKAFYKRLANLN
jgi:putative endonuclease